SAAGEISRMNEEVESLSHQTVEQRQKLSETSQEINDQEIALKQIQEQSEQKRDAVQKNQDQVQSSERKVFELFQQSAGSKNKLTEFETKSQGIEVRKQNLAKEKEETQNQIHSNQSIFQERESGHQTRIDELRQLKEQQESLKQKVLDGSNEVQAQVDAHSERKEGYFNKSSLLGSLEKLRSQFEGFNEGIKSLMSQQNGERIPGIREVLVDVLQTPAEYETAIETALGDKLQSVIVNSYSDSMEAIGYLKNNESGRGQFVPLNPKSTPSLPLYLNGTEGVVGKALNFIECSEDYRPVIELLLRNVVLVQDMDVAMHLHQTPEFQGTVVTLNGEMIDANGFVTGGSAKSESSRLLARNREIENLSESVKKLKAELEESQLAIESGKRAQIELETGLKQMNEEVHQKELANNNSLRDLEQLR
ncbi:MAG TPA: chromosome segregation protein SMC, partial [Nitrospina sp.]|nr:chromosome segregation protein SMC [Nitrospina sp.]